MCPQNSIAITKVLIPDVQIMDIITVTYKLYCFLSTFNGTKLRNG